MVGIIKNWIMSVTIVCIIGAVLGQFVPEGALKRGFNFVLGIALTVCIISPVRNITYSEILYFETGYKQDYAEKTMRLERTNRELTIKIIKEELDLYVLRKAGQLGLDCGVDITVKESDTGMLLPYAAEVIYIGSPDGKAEQLAEFIHRECGVPKERIVCLRRAAAGNAAAEG